MVLTVLIVPLVSSARVPMPVWGLIAMLLPASVLLCTVLALPFITGNFQMMAATLGAVVVGFLLYPLLSMAKERGWVEFTNLEIDYAHRTQGSGHSYTIHASGHLNYDDDNEYVDVAYDGLRRSTSSAVDLCDNGGRTSGQYGMSSGQYNYRMQGGTCTAAGGGGSYGRGGGMVYGGDVVKAGGHGAAAFGGGGGGDSSSSISKGLVKDGGENEVRAVAAGEGVVTVAVEAPAGAAWFNDNNVNAAAGGGGDGGDRAGDVSGCVSVAPYEGGSDGSRALPQQGFARLQSFKVEVSDSEIEGSSSNSSSRMGSPTAGVAAGGGGGVGLREPLLDTRDEVV
jgi:hypothetical protein